ncbi:helix-turn-helix transcriptional regulator [Aquicoccus porphyridii]|uniref:helix-turn-helix transcriptional regulator n=1 Tax=Aquicoccus porphyridii TaxID=1852029 RepID=UPI00273F2075|nr:helix-turn-helix transcriptional regulator [Aquicoccus porphyridii]
MTAGIEDHKYMLVLDDRLFYRGLLGHRMKTRSLGAVSIYLAPEGGFRLKHGNGPWTRRELAIVPPYVAHRAVSDCGSIISVLIEPERLDPADMERLFVEFGDPERRAGLLARLRAAAGRLSDGARGARMTTGAFDRIVLGWALRERRIDPRIETALVEMEGDGLESQTLAADLAGIIGLSSSRFLHLFKEQTGVSFRNHRMWRRARSFLLHANHSGSLTDVALSLGYPDSSHFSHSIRKTFGLQPRSIRIGSRNLRVDSNARAAASLHA